MAKRITHPSLAALTLLALPMLAWSHEGHDAGMHHGNSILAGMAHLFAEPDHLLMLVVIGIVIGVMYKLRRSA